MAHKNKVIRNHKTGQHIRFMLTAADTDGSLLEMEATYEARSKEPLPHYHPYQVEDFTVLSGTITIRIDGELKTLKAGDALHIPVNKVHSMWNNSDEKAVVNWKVKPAMNTEHLLETATGIANDKRTNKDGVPSILQVALMANKYSPVFRLAKPPFFIQRILFTALSPLAYLFGYRPTYKKYLD